MRQVIVMLWGAFEVFVTDLAVELLNVQPVLAERLTDLRQRLL